VLEIPGSEGDTDLFAARHDAWWSHRPTRISRHYWIIDLGANYEYAVVGHPSRDYLWILSRTRTMDDAVYEGLLGRLREQGYEVQRLNRTQQQAGGS
jgi:lipocalin